LDSLLLYEVCPINWGIIKLINISFKVSQVKNDWQTQLFILANISWAQGCQSMTLCRYAWTFSQPWLKYTMNVFFIYLHLVFNKMCLVLCLHAVKKMFETVQGQIVLKKQKSVGVKNKWCKEQMHIHTCKHTCRMFVTRPWIVTEHQQVILCLPTTIPPRYEILLFACYFYRQFYQLKNW
jgi:hypothetical protein